MSGGTLSFGRCRLALPGAWWLSGARSWGPVGDYRSGEPVADVRPKQWAKVPASEARPGEAWTCESFGTAKKGAATRVGDREAIAVHVSDKADKEATNPWTSGRPRRSRWWTRPTSRAEGW